MNKLLVLAVVLGGCSLYEGDDVEPGVDAGYLAPLAGAYRATWECQDSTPCVNPIADTIQAVVADGEPMTIAWVRNGDPGPRVTHLGDREGNCIAVYAGTDLGAPRDGYRLCINLAADPAVMLNAAIRWSGTTSAVTLERE